MGQTQPSRTTSMRRVLRREVAGTIGLLADEQDFAAMRRYRSFTFDDHTTYLRQVEGLLKTLAAAGGHTTVTLFDPSEFAEFCTAEGLDPDSSTSRTRFTAELAATGPGIAYQGQPLADLVPELVEEAVRQATWDYATSVLSRTGPCAACGQDIGRMAFARASFLVARVIDAIGEGAHHWVCSVLTDRESLHAVLRIDAGEPGTVRVDESAAMEVTAVLALAIVTRRASAVIVRSVATGEEARVYGWHLKEEALQPIPAGRVFDAYCTDADSGELSAPEPGVNYCTAPAVDDTKQEGRHRH
ncbi:MULTISPECIES: hypothetical protein [unclassified Streptomyces]|uniref:hypothetical protein n=1 Tax=unclassified Streptomyces TaxID=2593676 RepID=UPI00278BBABB|nr:MULTISPECIES: hypothetical protein [unclassified Streptomyces]